jgi:hypothetical protein
MTRSTEILHLVQFLIPAVPEHQLDLVLDLLAVEEHLLVEVVVS